MIESMRLFLKNLDDQIEAKSLQRPAGDRRQLNDLPEGMEERRKLQDRRKSRLKPKEKELE